MRAVGPERHRASRNMARHGGEIGMYADGLGVTFFEGPDVQVFREAGPAAGSPLVDYLQRHPRHSSTVVAHVRHATRGAISLASQEIIGHAAAAVARKSR